MTMKATVNLLGEREMKVERVFDAPRERVWRAYTDPELLAQWWGRGHKLDVEKHELKRGGHWRFVEHTPQGPQGFEGRFREVTPMDVLEQTFEWDGMPGHVAVERAVFKDEGQKTRVQLHSTFFAKEDRDAMARSGMEQGMNQSYAALDRLLETLKAL
jgi:uncharacterized protein YndB with AHSA1/START domain